MICWIPAYSLVRNRGRRLSGCHPDTLVDCYLAGLRLDSFVGRRRTPDAKPGRCDQMGPHLLQQVPPILSRKRLDEMLFGGSQYALKADHEEITEQVGANVLRSSAHVILFEATNSFTNGGFDFSLGLHGKLRRTFIFSLCFHSNLESACLMVVLGATFALGDGRSGSRTLKAL